MRALVSVSREPLHWLSGGPNVNSSDARLWISNLKDSSILISENSKRELLAAIKAETVNHKLVELLTDFIQAQPKARSSKLVVPDFFVGSKKPFQAINTDISEDIKQVAKTRSEELVEGMSTGDAYNKTIGLVAKFAKKVTIVDPYAGGSISSSNPKRSWLIKELFQDGVKSVHVVTTVPDNKEMKGLHSSQRLEKLKRAHSRLSNEAGRNGASFTVETYEPHPFFHHRRIAFSLDEGGIYFGLEKGIDGFAPGLAVPGEAFSEVRETAYLAYLNAIRAKLTRAE